MVKMVFKALLVLLVPLVPLVLLVPLELELPYLISPLFVSILLPILHAKMAVPSTSSTLLMDVPLMAQHALTLPFPTKIAMPLHPQAKLPLLATVNLLVPSLPPTVYLVILVEALTNTWLLNTLALLLVLPDPLDPLDLPALLVLLVKMVLPELLVLRVKLVLKALLVLRVTLVLKALLAVSAALNSINSLRKMPSVYSKIKNVFSEQMTVITIQWSSAIKNATYIKGADTFLLEPWTHRILVFVWAVKVPLGITMPSLQLMI